MVQSERGSYGAWSIIGVKVSGDVNEEVNLKKESKWLEMVIRETDVWSRDCWVGAATGDTKI